MQVIRTEIPDVLVLEPRVFGDARGFFMETYNARVLAEVAGITAHFVQDNHSRSGRHVLRGLHYQLKRPQGKLVRVTAGAVFDVAVDVRRRSPTFGRWVGVELSADNKRIAWVPPGFAHGFVVLTEFAEFLYKATDFYAPEDERCIAWNDPAIGVRWPLSGEPVLSARDRAGVPLADAEVYD
jgi:dTDP-4-dehydrorhamnose 3,5-epimerase